MPDPPTPLPFYDGAEYDPAVPTLRQVLGHDHGERICRAAEIVAYCQALTEASDRVRFFEYGRSVEGRPLIYLTISDPRNLERLEEIKANLRRLADPRECDRQAAAALVERTPAVTWVAANVHGGEHSSAEAALLLAYHLAAAEDERARTIRAETVVVIDPLQNPDGRERSVQYYYSAFGTSVNPDPLAAEHHWPWPGPRGNHYLFDLNRDWMLLTQAETPPKVRAFLEWRPQVYADLHEMGHNSTYYFFPPAPPVNANYPELTLRWWETYGRAIAAWFDERGFDYYTRERFDAFYPGYGESWPSFHGATGMTFEQAQARGLAIRRDDGSELTLRDGLHHHFIAALATCEVTARHRVERLWDHYAFHEDGLLHGRQGEVKEYLIPPQPGAARLAQSLGEQGIEVSVATAPFRPQEARDAVTGAAVEEELPGGTFIYRLEQPFSRFLQTVLEPHTALPEEFLREEVEHHERRLPDRFYDITAWSRALAMGLRLLETRRATAVETEPFAPAPPAPPSVSPAAAHVLTGAAGFPLAAASWLQRQGLRVHCARRGFTTAERAYPAGSLLVRRGGNERAAELIAGLPAELAAEIEVTSLPSLWTEAGVDLGSDDLVHLETPRVGVLYDWPVNSLSFGWIAYLLEQRYRIPFTALRREQIGSADFRHFTALVLPDGEAYGKAFDADQDRWLKRWVQAGGVLIGIGRGAAHLCRPEAELVGVRVVEDLRKVGEPEGIGAGTDAGGEEKDAPVPYPYQPVRVPGVFLRVDLDPYHPVAFGYPDPTEVFYDGSLLLAPGPATHAVATFAAGEQLEVSGFIWERMRRALPGHLWAAEERVGRGHVVLFAGDPAYRIAWEHMHRFLLNALLLMPSVKRPVIGGRG